MLKQYIHIFALVTLLQYYLFHHRAQWGVCPHFDEHVHPFGHHGFGGFFEIYRLSEMVCPGGRI